MEQNYLEIILKVFADKIKDLEDRLWLSEHAHKETREQLKEAKEQLEAKGVNND